MTPEDFVQEFHLLKTHLLEMAFDPSSGSATAIEIAALKLDAETASQFRSILSSLLTDALYTVLLGLDGEAQIGHRQEMYQLLDEAGNKLTGGEIEASAYEYFHGSKRAQ